MFSFGPSEKDIEEKRIADSIRVADSIAMVQAELQRVADSINLAQSNYMVMFDSIIQFSFSKEYNYYRIFTPSGGKNSDGSSDGNWSEYSRATNNLEFRINADNEVLLHNADGTVTKFKGITDYFDSELNSGMKYRSFVSTTDKGKKKVFQYLANGRIRIIDAASFSMIEFANE